MGAGCSAHTSAHEPHQRANATNPKHPPPASTSSSRLLTALGNLQVPSNVQDQPTPQPQQHEDPQQTVQAPATSQLSLQLASPPALSPDMFPTPTPSPARTPQAHVLSPGIEIQPAPDQPLLKQRQTIPPIIALEEEEDDEGSQAMVKASTFPTKLPTVMSSKSDMVESEDKESSSSGGMSRATSGDPTSNHVPLHMNRRRNSISVLPSIDPKPKFPGSERGEGKKSDPDLVLWISNKLKTKLKLARISKAYDRFAFISLFHIVFSFRGGLYFTFFYFIFLF